MLTQTIGKIRKNLRMKDPTIITTLPYQLQPYAHSKTIESNQTFDHSKNTLKRKRGLLDIEKEKVGNPQNKTSTYKMITSIKVSGKNLQNIIVGTKKKDQITGTSEGEILAGLKGKDVLKGGASADGFLFNHSKGVGKKNADQIKDFDPEEGDSILLDNDRCGLGKKIKLKT